MQSAWPLTRQFALCRVSTSAVVKTVLLFSSVVLFAEGTSKIPLKFIFDLPYLIRVTLNKMNTSDNQVFHPSNTPSTASASNPTSVLTKETA